MIFVDTGYFIARAHSRDSLHDRAKQGEKAVGEPLLVTEYVLWEAINLFSSAPDRPRGYAILSLVADSTTYRVLNAEHEWFAKGMDLRRSRTDKDWSLTDCISFEVTRHFRVTKALSHDHHFEQAGFEALLRREPPNIKF